LRERVRVRGELPDIISQALVYTQGYTVNISFSALLYAG
jgi:hypothetical protein